MCNIPQLEWLVSYANPMWLSALSLAQQNYSSFILCISSAFAVGLSGVVPLLFIPLETNVLGKSADFSYLNRWLSYATGSLLGEVFIHLLPETWSIHNGPTSLSSNCIIIGALFFFIVERLFGNDAKSKQIEGYLNLFLNVIDNFTHGVAIGASYLISLRLGILTTLCILIHEIPHEVSDFVILLRSGFTRWQAVKGQLMTASGSLVGAILTMLLDNASFGGSSAWILPFTAGGFLYIALVSFIPDILKEPSVMESAIHIGLILLGMATMLFVSAVLDQ